MMTMNKRTRAKAPFLLLAVVTALAASTASAAPAERVLSSWQHYGDVALQGDTLMLSTATAMFEDDAPLSAGYFNLSGQDAGAAGLPGGLEEFVGVAPGALDPDPVGHTVALYEGSAARLTVDVQAGDTLSFDWNLFTADTWMPDPALLLIAYTQAGDPATAIVLGTAAQATDSVASEVPLRQTGYQAYQHTFTSAGTVTLAWAVADHGDYNGSSQLALRNVRVTPAIPEPGALAMALSGVLLASLTVRRNRPD